MLGWTIFTWILTPILTTAFGYYGFPLVLLTIATSSLFVSVQAKKYVNFHFFASIYKALLSAALMGAVILVFLAVIPQMYPAIAVSVVAGAGVYFAALLFLFRINVVKELQALFVK